MLYDQFLIETWRLDNVCLFNQRYKHSLFTNLEMPSVIFAVKHKTPYHCMATGTFTLPGLFKNGFSANTCEREKTLPPNLKYLQPGTVYLQHEQNPRTDRQQRCVIHTHTHTSHRRVCMLAGSQHSQSATACLPTDPQPRLCVCFQFTVRHGSCQAD